MASKQQKEDEKHEKIVRGLLKLPGNRKCINCGSLGPQYVCTNFSTFICTLCSGIHREFSHRIKSISMAKFTTAEIGELQSGGNDRAREVFLKDWNSNRNIFPDSSNPDRIREFIKAVYEQRRFTGEKTNPETTRDGGNRSTYKSPILEDRSMRAVNGNRSYIKNVPNQNDESRYERNSHSDHRAGDHEQRRQQTRGRDDKISPEISHTTASGTRKETVLRQLLEPPVAMRRGTQVRRSISSGTNSSDTQPGGLGPAANGSSRELPTDRAPAVQRSNSMSLIDLITGPETATFTQADAFITTPDAKPASTVVNNTTIDLLDVSPLEIPTVGVKENVHVMNTSTGSNWSIEQLGIAPLSQLPTAQPMPGTCDALGELQQLSISENFFAAHAREASMPNMQAMGFEILPQEQVLGYGKNEMSKSWNPFDLANELQFPSPASTPTRTKTPDLSVGSVTFPTWSDTLITPQLHPIWESSNFGSTLNQPSGIQMMPNLVQGTFSDISSGYSNHINAQIMYNVPVPSNPFA